MGNCAMNMFKRTALAAALFLAVQQPVAAQWQTPNHSVPVGRGGGVQGFGNAVPGGAGVPLTSRGGSTDPAFGPASNAGIAPGAANTTKGSLDGAATSDIAIVACTFAYQITQWISGTGWRCGILPVLPSRAIAVTLNLSAFSVVQTLGYALPGDGGGAVFKNAATTPFIDTNVAAETITGGSGGTPGTYLGVAFPGGSGLGCGGSITINGGGAMSAVAFDLPCAGYTVGDVLTPFGTVGGVTGASFVVTSLAASMGSFTDAGNIHWQIVTDAEAHPNVRQFGCKLDWNGSDGSAANDLPCYISAVSFASYPFSSAGANINGTTIEVPKGNSFICGSNGMFAELTVPPGVTVNGSGNGLGGSGLRFCESNTTSHLVSLCGNLTTRGQIGCKLSNIAIFNSSSTLGASNLFAIYSSSGQQFPLIENIWIEPGLRGCIMYEKGTGGAANAIFLHYDCEGNPATTVPRILVAANVGSTQVEFTRGVIECSGQCTIANGAYGIALLGGNSIIDKLNMENINGGILVNNTLPTTIKNVTSGPNCSWIAQLTTANPNGKTLVENLTGGGCTQTISNAHSGGSSVTGDIVAQRVFSP